MQHIKHLLFLAMPTVGWWITVFCLAEENIVAIIFAYLLTILYIVLYVKLKLAKLFILPVSFILSPLAFFLYETINPGWFQYLVTLFGAFYYTLPFTVITAIIFLYLKIKEKRRSKP